MRLSFYLILYILCTLLRTLELLGDEPFGTLLLTAFVKFEGDISLLLAGDTGTLVPKPGTKDFEKLLFDLTGEQRTAHILENSTKAGDGKSKLFDMTSNGHFAGFGIVAFGGSRSLQEMVEREAPKGLKGKLNSPGHGSIAIAAIDKALKETPHTSYGVLIHALFAPLPSIYTRTVVPTGALLKHLPLTRATATGSPIYFFGKSQAVGLGANEEFVKKWQENTFGKAGEIEARKFNRAELVAAFRALGVLLRPKYGQHIGKFEVWLLRDQPGKQNLIKIPI